MYGKGAGSVIGSATVTALGVALLPNTSGNALASVLAYAAITIGCLALISQAAVRILRRAYRG